MPHHEQSEHVEQLLSTDSQIHRATVVSSNRETGEIIVRAPNVTGSESTINISMAGRKPVDRGFNYPGYNDPAYVSLHDDGINITGAQYQLKKWWPSGEPYKDGVTYDHDAGEYYKTYVVPEAGDEIIICREDADYTNVFWINTSTPHDPPYITYTYDNDSTHPHFKNTTNTWFGPPNFYAFHAFGTQQQTNVGHMISMERQYASHEGYADNTAQAGTTTTITLASSASSTDDDYKDWKIILYSGTGTGQAGTISDYVGSTKVATVTGIEAESGYGGTYNTAQDTWFTTPDSTTKYRLYNDNHTTWTPKDIYELLNYSKTDYDATISTLGDHRQSHWNYPPLVVQMRHAGYPAFVVAPNRYNGDGYLSVGYEKQAMMQFGMGLQIGTQNFGNKMVNDNANIRTNEGDFFIRDATRGQATIGSTVLWLTGHGDKTQGRLVVYSHGTPTSGLDPSFSSAERYNTMSLVPTDILSSGDGSERASLLCINDNWQPFYVNRHFVTGGDVYPDQDNQRDLGRSGNRWDDIYATNSSIQTSDRNDKTDIQDSDLGLTFINSLRPVSYKWKVKPSTKENSGDVSTNAGVRTHYGLIGQEVETVLGSAADTTAFWTKSSVKEQVAVEAQYDRSPIIGEENKVVGHNDVLLSPAKEAREAHEIQGLRYTELIAPMIKAIQELTTRVEALEG